MDTDMGPIVAIVDDDEGVRKALAVLLESAGYGTTLHDSATGFLAAGDIEGVDCILLDIRMPRMSGLEAQSALRERGILAQVVFITGHGDVSAAVRAMKGGAVDFIEKPFRGEVILDAVRRGVTATRRIREESGARLEVTQRIGTLTTREREVMELVVRGASNKLIARDLGISPRTVEVYRARVMEKMETPSLAELVQTAVRAGMA